MCIRDSSPPALCTCVHQASVHSDTSARELMGERRALRRESRCICVHQIAKRPPVGAGLVA
eukprot:6047723-Alexandrium_andersonii.AAC.1